MTIKLSDERLGDILVKLGTFYLSQVRTLY